MRLVQQILTRPEQRLRHDLAATSQSRARLVRSFDVERRRIERDLHDAVQPQLLSVSMTLGLALAALPSDSPGRDDIVRAQQQARKTLDDLRRVVRNIHPQVLIDHGLGSAVREIGDNFTIPVESLFLCFRTAFECREAQFCQSRQSYVDPSYARPNSHLCP